MKAMRVNARYSSNRRVLLAAMLAFVWGASTASATVPVLVSTDPSAGATGVDPLLGSFSLTFDQPMRNQGSVAITGPWGSGELLFVGDRTFFHFRNNPGSELPAGATITVTVNPPGSTNPFANLAGQPAATTTFSFTIAPGGTSPHVLSSVPSRGAIDVDPVLGSIVVQFSEPMNPTYRSFTLPAAWGTSSASWTPDYRTLTILRDDTSQPLPARDLVTLVLNPTGSANYFRDFDGSPLPKTTIAFGVEPYEHFPAVVTTDPPNGAVGVSTGRTSFTVTFSEPMSEAVSLSTSPRWGSSTMSWSGDRRILTVTRTNTTALPSDSRIEVNLDITPGQINWLTPPSFLRNPRGDRLPAYSFSFQVAAVSDSAVVTTTTPANGAVVDEPFLSEIVVHFDRPMQPFGCAGLSTTGDEWQGLPGSWSADQRSFHLVRSNPQTILRTGQEITIRLNPQECGNNPSFLFRGTDGHLLGIHIFTFTIGDGENELFAVPADPAQGFSWPYYLGVPPALTADAALLVEPNNTGAASNDLAVHDRAAEALALGRANHMADLGVPWLVPVFPRPVTPSLYTHALDRDTLETAEPGLERIDLQLIAMVADARRRLAERDLTIGSRILMNGFSASGAFAHRFMAIHPELVKAVASGSGAGWPIGPVAEWSGIDMRYPVGIADQTSLVGTPFSESAYRSVPLFLYVGTEDENDPVPGWDPVDRDAVFSLTGVTSGPIWPRWLVSKEIHAGAGMTAAQFAIYPGVGHTVTSAMSADIQAFLANPLPEPEVASGLLAALATLAGLARSRRWPPRRPDPGRGDQGGSAVTHA
jgi:hypothetical protein